MIDLAEKRKAAGLTQEQLAEKCHVVRTTIVRLNAAQIAPQFQPLKS